MKKKIDKLISLVLGSKQEIAEDLLNEILAEKFKDGTYEGQCKTLEFLNISPNEWDKIKKQK